MFLVLHRIYSLTLFPQIQSANHASNMAGGCHIGTHLRGKGYELINIQIVFAATLEPTNLLKQRFILFIVYFAKLLCWAVTWPCYCRYFPFHLGLNKIIFQMQGIKVHINKYLHNAQKGTDLSKLIRSVYFLARLLLTIMHQLSKNALFQSKIVSSHWKL